MKRHRQWLCSVYFLCLAVASYDAFAQSSLTLYGTVDMGIAYQSHSANDSGAYGTASRVGLMNGGQSGNRFGLKGKEQIASETELNFVLENGFSLGNGNVTQGGRIFGRQAWLGLKQNGLGTFRFGRQYDFAYEYASELTPFGPGDFANAALGLSFGSASAERFSNMIRFETDQIGGFKAGLGYSFSTQMQSGYTSNGALPVKPGDSANYNFSTQDNLRSLTSGLTYRAGSLYTTATYNVYYPNAATANDDVVNATAWILGAAYDLGLFKFSAAYGQTRNGWLNPAQTFQVLREPSNLGYLNSAVLFDPSIAVDSYLLGLSMSPDKSSTVFLSWQLAKPLASMHSNMSFPVDTQTVYSIAYTHNFTPRTNVYAFGAYSTNYSMSQGLTYALVGVGVRHKF